MLRSPLYHDLSTYRNVYFFGLECGRLPVQVYVNTLSLSLVFVSRKPIPVTASILESSVYHTHVSHSSNFRLPTSSSSSGITNLNAIPKSKTEFTHVYYIRLHVHRLILRNIDEDLSHLRKFCRWRVNDIVCLESFRAERSLFAVILWSYTI